MIMTITDTDRKLINILFEKKPHATGKDLLRLIEYMNVKTLNTNYGRQYVKNEIERIVRGE